MRIPTLLLAAVMLACEPTPADFVEPEADSVDPDLETVAAWAAGASETEERCGVLLDADYVNPHGDSVPKLWPARLRVEESDTIRFRVAPQEGTLTGSDEVESWSKPNWAHGCRRNGWGCQYYPGLNPLFAENIFDLWPKVFWQPFHNGDYSNKTYEYVLTEYLRKVPLEGRKCDARNRHCVGDETVRQVRLDVGFQDAWRGARAYGCHVMVNIVPDGSTATDDAGGGDPEYTVFVDPGPTIAIYSVYEQESPQSDDQRRRLEEGIRLLTAYGIQWDTLRHTQAAINFFAGTGDRPAITPRFFLHDPYETRRWWEPKPGVNNGGLRWLKKVVPPLGREARSQRKRFEQVKSLLEGLYWFSHEHHLAKLDASGVEVHHWGASENWITMQDMVDGLTGTADTRLPRIFVGNPNVSVGANGGVRWLRARLGGHGE